jgi:hypothetical protein
LLPFSLPPFFKWKIPSCLLDSLFLWQDVLWMFVCAHQIYRYYALDH